MKKTTQLLIMTLFALLLFAAGCGGTERQTAKTQAQPASSGQSSGQAGTADKTAGAAAFLNAEGLGEAVYDDAEKVFSNEYVNPGHWELKETSALGGIDASVFDLSCSGIKDSYPAGAACEPLIRFTQTQKQQASGRQPFGALYFTDPTAELTLSEPLTVKEYFLKKVGPVYAPVQMNAFSPNNDGISSSYDDSAGRKESEYSPRGYFPKKVAEGDELWLVLDISETANGEPQRRTVWK